MTKRTLTFTTAVLLALNTMIGGGIFVNPKQLAIVAGSLSPLGYVIAACLMLPLILSVTELARLQPVSGGLYVYSKSYVSPLAGFLSGWAYFLSKATSAAFLVHTVNTFFQNHFSILQGIPPLVLDASLIIFLTTLHAIGISITSNIQYFFSFMKFTPLLFGFAAGFIAFNGSNLSLLPPDLSLSTISAAVPVCLYALVGFEIICSIGGFIENPARNIRRTILTAFGIVTAVAILFQLLMFGALGSELAYAKEPMLALGCTWLNGNIWLAKLMNGLVFASITGGAFFMIGSNCWNLFTLAKDGNLPFTKSLTATNRFGSPWIALILQAVTSILMIGISSQQLPLQNMVVFSLFGSFLMTCFAAFNASKLNLLNIPRFVPLLAIGTCAYVLGMCFSNILKYGVSLSFLSFFAVGLIATILVRCTKKEDQP